MADSFIVVSELWKKNIAFDLFCEKHPASVVSFRTTSQRLKIFLYSFLFVPFGVLNVFSLDAGGHRQPG